MGRSRIQGPYGKTIPKKIHGIPDDQLLNGAKYGKHRGLSRQRVHVNFQQGLINRYENSKGSPMYHPASCDAQWEECSDPTKVTTATQGQKAKGWDNNDAIEHSGSFERHPIGDGDHQSEAQPVKTGEKKEDGQSEKNIIGRARAKKAVHESQLKEYAVLREQKVLVNRDAIERPIVSAAQFTRDRVMSVANTVAKLVYADAHGSGNQHECEHAIKATLREALKDALIEISEKGMENVFR